MPGTVELAEQMYDMPVRLGTVAGYDHIPDELIDSKFATALGLGVYGAAPEPQSGSRAGGSMRGILRKIENWISKQF